MHKHLPPCFSSAHIFGRLKFGRGMRSWGFTILLNISGFPVMEHSESWPYAEVYSSEEPFLHLSTSGRSRQEDRPWACNRSAGGLWLPLPCLSKVPKVSMWLSPTLTHAITTSNSHKFISANVFFGVCIKYFTHATHLKHKLPSPYQKISVPSSVYPHYWPGSTYKPDPLCCFFQCCYLLSVELSDVDLHPTGTLFIYRHRRMVYSSSCTLLHIHMLLHDLLLLNLIVSACSNHDLGTLFLLLLSLPAGSATETLPILLVPRHSNSRTAPSANHFQWWSIQQMRQIYS